MPTSMPAAMKMMSPTHITVRPIQAAPKSFSLTPVSIACSSKRAQPWFTRCSPSFQNLWIRATRPAMPSARAARVPLSPEECSARSVSAAAMPLGKRSCSMLIICRFIGTAMVTPSTARKKIHPSMSGSDSDSLLSMM
jgi:hypothetical protein